MNNYIKIPTWIIIVIVLIGLGCNGCRPEMPVTSTIIIDAEATTIPVNDKLYGYTLEEINHAIDGGLYAEMIQNRSFEDGVPPLNCPYDYSRNVITTPNGWSIPFIKPDSIPGWRKISNGTSIWIDSKELINDKNRRSLFVSVSASSLIGKGGVVATGYNGISVRRGDKYNLSFYLKGTSLSPKKISVGLMDSTATNFVSDIFKVSPVPEWKQIKYTFTATEDSNDAVLAFSADTSIVFWLDVVSLFPEKTWKNRRNGVREDLVEMLDTLRPGFIRFPGGSFVEGYTAGTYPIWKETVGNIAERKHFWNVWAYGTTNGMGYHEYLQLCEDLKADPIYVVNSGVTSQSRRPRYEDITAMSKMVQDALDAIAYANQPKDSILGAMRAKNGHPEPFGLKYIEIGSENYGQEYIKRYNLFKEAINAAYPDITVISSYVTTKKNRFDWVDSHFYSGEDFLIASNNQFEPVNLYRRSVPVFIGEFSAVQEPYSGTLRAAIGEACFLIGMERYPDIVKRVAYAPLFGNSNFDNIRPAAIRFNNHQTIASPSYYMLWMFGNYRGDEVLKTVVHTWEKPQVTFGRAAIELFDNSYEFKDVKINNNIVREGVVTSGGWNVEDGRLVPMPNRWNHILIGDSVAHDYVFSASIRRTKGSGQIQLRVRDNGKKEAQSDYICMTIGAGMSEFFRQSGLVKDSLVSPIDYPFESNRWYDVRMVCKDDTVTCYIDNQLLHKAAMRPIPSLVSIATLDKEKHMIYLKVVNTTYHEEKTELVFEGISVKNDAEVLQLIGRPEDQNTFIDPNKIKPVIKEISFPLGGPMVYKVPPNSISIIKLKVD